MTPLCELAVKYGTDKCSPVHQYTPMYWELLSERRELVRRVMEIGVGSKESMGAGYQPGASLRMWEEFFSNADIYGLDVNRNVLSDAGRVRCLYCDQGSRESLETALQAAGGAGFDLIVDDGSHERWHQILSAVTLAPALAPGGMYVIEDLVAFNLGWFQAEFRFGEFTFMVKECPCERDAHEKAVVIRRDA